VKAKRRHKNQIPKYIRALSTALQKFSSSDLLTAQKVKKSDFPGNNGFSACSDLLLRISGMILFASC
jgi:hypothetical protein